MLMRVQTPFTILGYPGLAMRLFLFAAGGAFWMAWTILAGDVEQDPRQVGPVVNSQLPIPNLQAFPCGGVGSWELDVGSFSYYPCWAARSAGGMAISSGCADSCDLTIASARATASASPAR